MPKFFNAPAGTTDFLPDDQDFFTFIKKVVRHRFRQSGFRRISPPVFEEVGVFQRSLGEDSEMVRKHLYQFEDRQGREYALRPEITPGVVRAFIENEMDKGPLPVELYYIEPCFRLERITPRNKREFWQFGAEVLGESDPSVDAQVIYLAHKILSDLQLREHVDLQISTLGSEEDRARFQDALANFYSGKERSLTPGSQEKLKQGRYLELLHPQSEDEQILLEMAPKVTEFLSEESKTFFDQVLSYLDAFQVPHKVVPTIKLSADYVSHTVFQFLEKESYNKIITGSRYDGLIKQMGGNNHGAVGFAAGVERVIQLMKSKGLDVPHKDYLQIFVAATGLEAKRHALPILVQLREHGFHAVGVLGKTSMNEQLRRAERFKVPYAVLIGDLEVKKKVAIVRDMKKGKSETISMKDLVGHMEKLLEQELDTTTDFLGHP